MATIYGIWDPVKDQPGPVNNKSWMEWWPSMRAAHDSMRARLYPGGAVTAVDPARHVHREDRPDAQWGGSIAQSCIYLYDTPDSDKPYGLVEFGPRAGVQFHRITEEPRTVTLTLTCDGREFHSREIVVHPWHLHNGARTEDHRWAKWLGPATDLSLRLLDVLPPDPYEITATAADTATGEQLAAANIQ
jgi:hypothetical protein